MRSLLALALLVCPSVGQTHSRTEAAPIQVPPERSAARLLELAANVRPSPRQLAWQETGFNAFVHFGMNTFTGREWGEGNESPERFDPKRFDAAQWARSFAAAGMRGVVLTCKHHDGFCLWPSATTRRDVAASPFRGGKGDVVDEVAKACREHGLRFGVYLSPWDRSQRSFGTKAYEAIFLAQLRELCAGYGELFEIWFAAVGGNAVLLLNVPPNDQGLIPDPDVRVLTQLGSYLQKCFAEDIAKNAELRRTSQGPEWHFDAPVTVDVFDLREDVANAGQRVESFRVEVLRNERWELCAKGTTIGFRRLLRTEPVTGTAFRYRIETSRAEPVIAHFGLHLQPRLTKVRRD